MRQAIMAAVLLVLAGCGVDGAPVAPAQAPAATAPGLTIEGDASFGVVGEIG